MYNNICGDAYFLVGGFMDLALKEFVEKNIHLIEENRFKELYIIAEVDPDIEVYDLTILLYSIGIDPLKELDYIPSNFMIGTHLNAPQIIDLSHLTHIKHIENYAFAFNNNLKEIILPPNLETIGSTAFLASGLKKIVIPKSVKAIGDAAFMDCKNLSEIVIEGKPTINLNAFAGDHIQRIYYVHDDSVAYKLPMDSNNLIQFI